MSVSGNEETVWLIIGLIAAWMVLSCLRVIGLAYYNAVEWHNLKVQVHNLRIEQNRRLQELEDQERAEHEQTMRRVERGIQSRTGMQSTEYVEELETDPVPAAAQAA